MGFERIGVDEVWKGRIADVRVERWRMEDGEEVEREVVGHPGAVGIVAHDGEVLYLVSQPREPVGEARLLELPAGKLDDDSEDVLATAKRELAEENERIEIVKVPLSRVDELIRDSRDSKTLVGLLWLKAFGSGAA